MNILGTIIEFYIMLIFAYVILSWFPLSGIFLDLHRVLATVCEPYLGVFRRIIPPIGMIDITPIVGIVVLQILQSFVSRLAL